MGLLQFLSFHRSRMSLYFSLVSLSGFLALIESDPTDSRDRKTVEKLSNMTVYTSGWFR